MNNVETAIEKANKDVIARILDDAVLKSFQALKQNTTKDQGTTPGNSFQMESIPVI